MFYVCDRAASALAQQAMSFFLTAGANAYQEFHLLTKRRIPHSHAVPVPSPPLLYVHAQGTVRV
jgi:hypothetical protein